MYWTAITNLGRASLLPLRDGADQRARGATVRLLAVPVLLDQRWGVRLWC